jgi:hypothetical protein
MVLLENCTKHGATECGGRRYGQVRLDELELCTLGLAKRIMGMGAQGKIREGIYKVYDRFQVPKIFVWEMEWTIKLYIVYICEILYFISVVLTEQE